MEVLKKALEGMSNGIPVFVSVPDQLDSDDADELSGKNREDVGLDSRFTMIAGEQGGPSRAAEGASRTK